MSDKIAKVSQRTVKGQRDSRHNLQPGKFHLHMKRISPLIPKVVQGGTGVKRGWGIAALEGVQGYPSSTLIPLPLI